MWPFTSSKASVIPRPEQLGKLRKEKYKFIMNGAIKTLVEDLLNGKLEQGKKYTTEKLPKEGIARIVLKETIIEQFKSAQYNIDYRDEGDTIFIKVTPSNGKKNYEKWDFPEMMKGHI